jgi:ATP-binding cassette, subfamily D (ALD), peroxisomal long-chain fatty acid import protein
MVAQSTLRQTAPELEVVIETFFKKNFNAIRARLQGTSKATRLAGACALTVSIILSARVGQRWWKQRQKEKEEGRKLVRTNSFIANKDGSRTIYVPYKKGTAKVRINETNPLKFEAHRRLFLNPSPVSGARLADGFVPAVHTKAGVNIAFVHQFASLMNIAIPRIYCREFGLLVALATSLFARTYISLRQAKLEGAIVQNLVSRKGRLFALGTVKVCVLAWTTK